MHKAIASAGRGRIGSVPGKVFSGDAGSTHRVTDMVDIPVKTLDDSTMLKVMANENMDSWALGPRVIDETIAVTKRFLEEHLEEAAKYSQLEKVNRDAPPIGAGCISRFLGWNETRVRYSLERLHLIDDGILDKESVESMPTDNAARELVDGNDKRIMRVNGNGEEG
jgi:predicted transcriptional regulator